MSTSRRVAPVPQLKCISGPCHQYPIEVVQCRNVGNDGFEVQWEVCKLHGMIFCGFRPERPLVLPGDDARFPAPVGSERLGRPDFRALDLRRFFFRAGFLAPAENTPGLSVVLFWHSLLFLARCLLLSGPD